MQYRTPSSSTDSISGFTKKPLKWVEHPLNQFNEVTIPQRVDLLRKHKCNIERFLRAGDFSRANREQLNATNLVRQLKRELSDIEDLRNQVQAKDLVKFDQITENARRSAALAVEEYLQLGSDPFTQQTCSLNLLDSENPVKCIEHFNNVTLPQSISHLKEILSHVKKLEQNGKNSTARRRKEIAIQLLSGLKVRLCDISKLQSKISGTDLLAFHENYKMANSAIQLVSKELEAFGVLPSDEMKLRDGGAEKVPVDIPQLKVQAQVDGDLSSLEDCVRSWESLHEDIDNLHTIFQNLSEIASEQGEIVDSVECNIEKADNEIKEGTNHLRRAARFKAAMYPLAGALLGTCVGGPVGLVAGLKLGGLAAVGCSVAGFVGGRWLKRKQEKSVGEFEMQDRMVFESEVQDNSSLPSQSSSSSSSSSSSLSSLTRSTLSPSTAGL